MLLKSYDLTGNALNWAVAQAEGLLVNNETPAGFDPVNDDAQASVFIGNC